MSRRQLGLSLTESLVTLVVLGIVTAVALPSLRGLAERQRFEGSAQRFVSEFQSARLQALSTRVPVHVRFHQHAGGSGFTLHQGARDACSLESDGQPRCTDGAQLLSMEWWPAQRGVQLSANVARMTLNPATMTVSPTGSVRISSSQGQARTHVVALTGRIRTVAS